MPKRITIAQPVTTDVTLAPLNESYWLEYKGCGSTEQWYNSTQQEYTPDYSTNPLIVEPHISVFDKDTNRSHTPGWYRVDWYLQDNAGEFTVFVPTYVSLAAMISAGGTYGSINNTLYVIENIAPTKASVPVFTRAFYYDPRDRAITHEVQKQFTLVLHQDATITIPIPHIAGPKTLKWEPLSGESSQKTIHATAKLGDSDVTQTSTFKWYAWTNGLQAATPIDATTSAFGVTAPVFPGYVSGQGTPSLVIDMSFSEKMLLVLRIVNTGVTPNADYPGEDTCTLQWGESQIDVITKTDMSQRVDINTQFKVFDIIVNARRADKTTESISASEIQENILVNWKRRAFNSGTVNDEGWGPNTIINGEKLRTATSQQVHAEVYMRGAKELVTYGGEALTYNNELIYERS